MAPENPDVDKLIDMITDGAEVDWSPLLAACRDDRERSLVEQLRVMSEVARATDPRVASSRVGSAPDSGASQPPLFTWGPLEVFEELGRGTFGRVFRARDPRLDREAALKLFEQSRVAETSFLREAQLLARVRHPHVVAVYGADAFDETGGLWMELIRGRSLRAIVQEHGPFGPRETALIALDLCAALAAVHGAGLVHRDIKANNVMREVGGRIVLMDFGAGMTSQTVTADAGTTGTPLYMAPELFVGTEASVSTDLYALGVLLYFAVTGGYPVNGRSVAELRDAHARGARRWLREARADVPATLAQVIDRALNPDPAARFPTAADMEQALAATLDVHGRARGRDAATGSGWRHWASRPLPAWLMVATLATAVAATLAIGSQLARPGGTNENRRAGWIYDELPTGGRRPLTAELWELIDGHHELAGSLGAAGDWVQAAEHYDKIKALLMAQGWRDEPYRSHVMAMLAWAQIHMGKPDDGRVNLNLALYKVAQEGGVNHPLLATLEMMSAVERHASGDPAGAAAAVIRAIECRRNVLAAAGIAVTPLPAVAAARLTDALTRDAPDRDQDGDWIPDVIERAVALDPTRRDTDGNGIPDDEEDTDGAGSSNGLRWGIVADPTRVLAHFGNLDPERAGYRRALEFVGTGMPSNDDRGPSWNVKTDRQGFYYQKLTRSQKRDAMSRGWRLVSAGALWSGGGFANVDFIPAGARFDQNVFIHSDGQLWARANTSVTPLEGPAVQLGSRGKWAAVETVFEPSNSSAKVFVGGKRFQGGYHGHGQFQEDLGLFFGSNRIVGTAPSGEADFSLVLLQIR
jgi:hypothetical protein